MYDGRRGFVRSFLYQDDFGQNPNLATLPLVGRPKIDFGRRNEVRPCSAAKLNTFYTNW